jgi:ribosomal-protein-serine acetyltransferase
MLYLQRAQQEHAPLWFELLQNNRAWLEPWMPHLKAIQTLEQAQAYLKKYATLDIYLGAHIYELWTEGGTLVGLAQVHSGRFTTQSVELAYWLGQAYTGKGYATTACRRLIAMLFATQPRIQRVHIRCKTANRASQKVAQRLGMQLLSSNAEEQRYGLSKTDWPQDPDYWLWFLEDN